MIVSENYFYTVKDEFFTDYKNFLNCQFIDNKLECRPFYYPFEDRKTGLPWLIPLSTKIKTYEPKIEREVEKRGFCDGYHIIRNKDGSIYKIGGQEGVFLILKMFPLTKKYLKENYYFNTVPQRLVSENHIKPIDKKCNKMINLLKRGTLTRNDVDLFGLEQALLESLRI